MTYQTTFQTHDCDTVEEASSLLTSVTGSPAPAPSFAFGQGGGGGVPATKKKNRVPSIRAMIVTTCLLLGTITVIYLGGSSSGGISNTHRRDGTPSLSSSVSSLSSLRTATLEECHPNGDPCYGGYWFLTNGGCCDTASCVRKNGGDSCDVYTDSCVCVDNPTTAPSPSPTTSPTHRPTPTPTFRPTERPTPHPTPVPTFAPTKNPTRRPTFHPTPTPTSPPTSPPTPPPTTHLYDPSQDYCFKDKENDDKYCWYPTENFPVGNWEGKGGRGYNNCGPKCTEVYDNVYDPSKDFCFADKRNAGKYCWGWKDILPYPRRQWKGEGGHGYDNCGELCTQFNDRFQKSTRAINPIK